jgi:hypothetical protein
VVADVNVVSQPNETVGQGDLVTTDGTTWNHYENIPVDSLTNVLGISCPTTSDCWIAGSGPNDEPEVAQSTDGGQTWTLRTPASWTGAGATWWPNSIDCVSTLVCWVVGMSSDSSYNPAAAETTDGGTTWTTFSNLPPGPPHAGPGTYILNGISCTSPTSCVAVGGNALGNSYATVIITTDGGVTWSMSADPALAGIGALEDVSCVPGNAGLADCSAVGSALEGAGPIEISSADGGATWSGVETYDHTSYLRAISCADAAHCWATGANSTLALIGTADAGATWTQETSDTVDENGKVSCSSTSFCVATTDKALWVTTDDGGLGATPAFASPATAGHLATATHRVTRPLPKISARDIWIRAGRNAQITAQYRGTTAAKTASAMIVPPRGSKTQAEVRIGLNHYYSVTIRNVQAGTTTVTFAAGDAKTIVIRVHGHPGPAPAISGLTTHAGPLRGGNLVTVTGTNFTKVTAVRFGSKAGTAVTVKSPKRLTVRAPAGAGAPYLTVITSSGGPSALTGHAVYNYLPVPSVRTLSPASGPASGGTAVTITGSNLAFIKAVYFGTRRATRVVARSGHQITVVDPVGSGTVNVRISTLGGISAIAPHDQFTY